MDSRERESFAAYWLEKYGVPIAAFDRIGFIKPLLDADASIPMWLDAAKECERHARKLRKLNQTMRFLMLEEAAEQADKDAAKYRLTNELMMKGRISDPATLGAEVLASRGIMLTHPGTRKATRRPDFIGGIALFIEESLRTLSDDGGICWGDVAKCLEWHGIDLSHISGSKADAVMRAARRSRERPHERSRLRVGRSAQARR